MAHNLEEINGVVSFAENVGNERHEVAWHNLGQRVTEPMFVADALKLCHADFEVTKQPLFAFPEDILTRIHNNEPINGHDLVDYMVMSHNATMRTDKNSVLGIVGKDYGIVQNAAAFKFVDMFCSGEFAERDNTPVIETCGVLGGGERIFVTAKFPKSIVMDANRDDLVDMYVVFTTTHDGTGAVRCLVTPVRVVCNNTLNWAMNHNIGRVSFRHTINVNNRLDLLKAENANFAYKAMNVYQVYEQGIKQSFEALKLKKLTERNIEDIIAQTILSKDAAKVFMETRDINNEEIKTRGRNLYNAVRECLESGVGQDRQERGTAMWLMNGLTSYYQNNATERDAENKFNSIFDGTINNKVQQAYDLCMAI